MAATTRRLLAAALRDLQTQRVSVLRHRDTSPQNCLFEGDRSSALSIGRNAESCGAPGFDLWNAAVAWLEHSVGLTPWSHRHVLEVFRAAWGGSEFCACARESARESARAAGVSERRLDALEVTFFGRRLGRRLETPEAWATGPQVSVEMLEVVCAPSFSRSFLAAGPSPPPARWRGRAGQSGLAIAGHRRSRDVPA
jgi:hypothetical protein